MFGAGLVIGTYLPFKRTNASVGESCRDQAPFAPNAFIRIGADGIVTVMIRNIEFGQGPATGLATLVAEELDADGSKVRAKLAPSAPAYVNELFGMQWGFQLDCQWMQRPKRGMSSLRRIF